MAEAFWQFAFKCLGSRSNLDLMKQMKRREEVISQARKVSLCYLLKTGFKTIQLSQSRKSCGFLLLSLMLALTWETRAARGVESYMRSQAEWGSAGAE